MGVCKDCGQRSRTKRGQKSRKPKLAELIKRAQRAISASQKLAEERREIEDRFKSWCPQELVDFWKGNYNSR